MRYFAARCVVSQSWDYEIDDMEYLYEEFGKEAFLCPFDSKLSEYYSDREGKADIIGVSIVIMDTRADEAVAEKYLRKALDIWKLTRMLRVEVKECTFKKCFHDGCDGFWTHYENSSFFQVMNLFELHDMLGDSELFQENILAGPIAKETALAKVGDTAYSKSLSAELQRVYETTYNEVDTAAPPGAFPVHYLLEGNAPSKYQAALELLLGALLATGRLKSRHVFQMDLDKIGHDRFRRCISKSEIDSFIDDALLEAIKGNTFIVKYGIWDEGGTYDSESYKALTKILELTTSYLDDTQIVFLIPPGKADLIMRLRRNMPSTLVTISEDGEASVNKGDFESSLSYLKNLAEKDGLQTDERLEVLLDDCMHGASYGSLDQLYTRWRRDLTIRTSYPQYRKYADETINLQRKGQATPAIERLDELVGLDEAKQLIKNIILRLRMNRELEYAGLPVQPISLHLAFLGAPGTGKTEVARLYGQILKEEGMLSEGRVITVSGSSNWDVRETFDAARGSVLFIDEAYGLLSCMGNCVTEIIALMEERREDTVVILAGYENQMERLLDSNSGFRSRLGFVMRFPDYTPQQLLSIFQLMCKRAELHMSDEVESALKDILHRGGRREDQGNARYVRKLFEDSIGAQQIRLAREKPEEGYSKEDLQTILLQDLGYTPPNEAGRTAREELADLIGLGEVKKIVSARLDLAHIQKVKRDAGLMAPYIPLHMVFKGNPGTGKTEVARLIGRILGEEGVLSVGDVYECGRQDLVGPVVGSTAPKVEALFRRARGSVIFIDEAYSLIDSQKGGFGDEAITTIIAQMEKLRDDVVVILAGYTQEMDNLLSLNPGFKSRIGVQIDFPDYSVGELLEILEYMAKDAGMRMETGVIEKVEGILQRATCEVDFGNARFVRTLLESALLAQSVRLSKLAADDLDEQMLMTLLPEDFEWQTSDNHRSIGFNVG